MARGITLINADLQADGSLKLNPSTTAGTVYALIEIDDGAMTAIYNAEKAKPNADQAGLLANWDRTVIMQAIETASLALSKYSPPLSPAQIAAQAAAVTARAALAASIVTVDNVP